MDQIIHMTATYSNALLVAILPYVSDVAKKLNLPIEQPVTLSQVKRFNPSPYKEFIGGGLGLTNHYWFAFSFGCVDMFRSPDNWFTEQDIVNLERYVGKDNMTTNEAIELARRSFRSLGYKPEDFQADGPPTEFQGPVESKKLGHIPFCRVEWNSPEPSNLEERHRSHNIKFDIDMQRKQVVEMSLIGRKFWRPSPNIDVETELESEYRRRVKTEGLVHTNEPQAILPLDSGPKLEPGSFNGTHAKMFTRTNAPQHFPGHAVSPVPAVTADVPSSPPVGASNALRP